MIAEALRLLAALWLGTIIISLILTGIYILDRYFTDNEYGDF